jgi:hypothetical protein
MRRGATILNVTGSSLHHVNENLYQLGTRLSNQLQWLHRLDKWERNEYALNELCHNNPYVKLVLLYECFAYQQIRNAC